MGIPEYSTSSNFYEILEVAPTATQEEIARAFRQLALEHHPDLGGDPAAMVELNRAYEVLKDPEQRAIYDEYLGIELAGDSEGFFGDAAVGEPPPEWMPRQEEEPEEPEGAVRVAKLALRMTRDLTGFVFEFLTSGAVPWFLCYCGILMAVAIAVKNVFGKLRLP